jgi:hypothetical protein
MVFRTMLEAGGLRGKRSLSVCFSEDTARFVAKQLQGYFRQLCGDGGATAMSERTLDFDELNGYAVRTCATNCVVPRTALEQN